VNLAYGFLLELIWFVTPGNPIPWTYYPVVLSLCLTNHMCSTGTADPCTDIFPFSRLSSEIICPRACRSNTLFSASFFPLCLGPAFGIPPFPPVFLFLMVNCQEYCFFPSSTHDPSFLRFLMTIFNLEIYCVLDLDHFFGSHLPQNYTMRDSTTEVAGTGGSSGFLFGGNLYPVWE